MCIRYVLDRTQCPHYSGRPYFRVFGLMYVYYWLSVGDLVEAAVDSQQ